MTIMEFLDHPIVTAILIFVAVIIYTRWLIRLVKWLQNRYAAPHARWLDKKMTKGRRLQLDALVAKLSAGERRDIEALLEIDQKITAIKLFRAATNDGLRDAKNAVEYIALCRSIQQA